MMMKDLIIRNSITNDVIDDGGPDFEAELARLSPQGIEYSADPYRCPVSTPAGYERVVNRERNNSYVSFSGLNRSYKIPKNINGSKQQSQKSRPQSKPQKKNFDCYFMGKMDKVVPVRRESTWLTALCSQPVDEIFHKYKRKSEAKSLAHRNSSKCRYVSTPGEKALVFAWSSNSSQRDSPSLTSRSVRSDFSKFSRKSNADQSLKVYGYESDPDRFLSSSPGFALMPVPSPTIPEVDSVVWSSAGSSLNMNQKLNNKTNNAVVNYVNETPVATNVYEPFTREKKFPVIKRKKSLSPAKKKLPSEPIKLSTSLPSGINELEESPIEIISVGSFLNNETAAEPQKAAPVKPFCSYRLPKHPPSSLPEIKGKG